MEKKQKILEYRERFDKTLSSPGLTNEESIKTLVKNRLLCSSPCDVEGDIENVVQKRTMEVSNFLEMLRSASGNDSEKLKTHGISRGDWKLKQDDDQLRVMYREGPQGTPFHTLLAEGYVDAPIDVCLCVSWESTLYKKWWPQFNIPSFKITMGNCLQKVCIGEEISLVRVKVPWPVSAREALLHYFEVEYFEDDLIIVLLNTISDVDHLSKSTHGFTNDGIPEAKDTVRLDLVGGFALQKVSSNTSYFRTTANLDIKLDFVPPTLINFISRQLIGSGFKLYQKIVASVANGDVDFSKVLEEGPMYVRVREGLQKSYIDFKKDQEAIDEENYASILSEDHATDIAQADIPAILDQPFVSEIEEDDTKHKDCPSTSPTIEQCHVSKEEAPSGYPIARPCYFSKEKAFISPEVECALSILDKAIAIIRGRVSADSNQTEPLSANQDFLILENDADAWVPSSKDGGVCLDSLNIDETEDISTSCDFRSAEADPSWSEADQNQTVSASENQRSPILDAVQEELLLSSSKEVNTNNARSIGSSEGPVPESSNKAYMEAGVKANGTHESSSVHGGNEKINEKKKHRLCCLRFI